MRVALIGATGTIGSRILDELLNRGHAVTALSRHADSLATRPGLTAQAMDAADTEALIEILKGQEAMISAMRFHGVDYAPILEAARRAGVRLLMVGGAGSLKVETGDMLMNAVEFPEMVKVEAGAGLAVLRMLQNETEVDWTFLSPSQMIRPGVRTGQFRLGQDDLLVGPQGSSISCEDYAVAMVDELERPAHSRRRFTVGY